MSRLIDADKLINAINKSTCNWTEHLWKQVVCDVIHNQPTAYDVDKVVEQLEERSKEYNSGVRLHGKPEEMLTHEAIEIVKAGGLNENNQ